MHDPDEIPMDGSNGVFGEYIKPELIKRVRGEKVSRVLRHGGVQNSREDALGNPMGTEVGV